MLSYYTELCFMIKAINEMYKIKTKDKTLDFKQNKLGVSFCNKIKLITGCCPNKKILRMMEKGYKRLSIDFDIIEFIK